MRRFFLPTCPGFFQKIRIGNEKSAGGQWSRGKDEPSDRLPSKEQWKNSLQGGPMYRFAFHRITSELPTTHQLRAADPKFDRCFPAPLAIVSMTGWGVVRRTSSQFSHGLRKLQQE